MKPFSVSLSAVGVSDPIPLDHYQANFNVGLNASISATATYSVQFTMDDLSKGPPVNWYVLTGWSALAAAQQGSFSLPCTAIRLDVTATTGTVTLAGLQAGH